MRGITSCTARTCVSARSSRTGILPVRSGLPYCRETGKMPVLLQTCSSRAWPWESRDKSPCIPLQKRGKGRATAGRAVHKRPRERDSSVPVRVSEMLVMAGWKACPTQTACQKHLGVFEGGCRGETFCKKFHSDMPFLKERPTRG